MRSSIRSRGESGAYGSGGGRDGLCVLGYKGLSDGVSFVRECLGRLGTERTASGTSGHDTIRVSLSSGVRMTRKPAVMCSSTDVCILSSPNRSRSGGCLGCLA